MIQARPGLYAGFETIMFAPVPPFLTLPLMIGPLGMQEMLIILMVALIVFGPRKLPQIGKTLGKSIAEFRRTSTELRSTLEREVQMEEFRAARTEVSDLRKDVTNLGRGLDPEAGSDPAAATVPQGESAATAASEAEPGPTASESENSANGASTNGPPASGAETAGAEESADAGEQAGDTGDSESESAKDSGK